MLMDGRGFAAFGSRLLWLIFARLALPTGHLVGCEIYSSPSWPKSRPLVGRRRRLGRGRRQQIAASARLFASVVLYTCRVATIGQPHGFGRANCEAVGNNNQQNNLRPFSATGALLARFGRRQVPFRDTTMVLEFSTIFASIANGPQNSPNQLIRQNGQTAANWPFGKPSLRAAFESTRARALRMHNHAHHAGRRVALASKRPK